MSDGTEASSLQQYTLAEILATALYASRIRDKNAAMSFALSTLQRLREFPDE